MKRDRKPKSGIGVAFGELVIGALITIAATVACFVVFVALQALSYMLPNDQIESHLRQAFVTGDLTLANSRPYDAERGYHQRNDCVIYWMALSRPDDIGKYIASAQYYWDETQRAGYCQTLRDYLIDDPTAKYREGIYLRYLHGYRAATAFALHVLDVPQMRGLFKGACFGLLALVAAAAIWRIASPRQNGDRLARARAFAGLGLAAVFGSLYGLNYFGQSPSHAPANCALFLFLLITTQVDIMALSRWRLYGLIGVFGALVAFFEFLTGAAVLGLAMLIALTAVQGARLTPGFFVLRGALMASAYVGAIVLSFALNLGLNSWYFGSETILRFFDQLAVRMGTTVETKSVIGDSAETVVTFGDVFDALLRKLDFLTYGDPIVAQQLFLGFGFAFAAFMLVAAINVRRFSDVLRVAAFLASVGVIVVWYALFKNHTVIHSAFMVRVLVWAPAAAVLAGVVAAEFVLRGAASAATTPRPSALREQEA